VLIYQFPSGLLVEWLVMIGFKLFLVEPPEPMSEELTAASYLLIA
jgi:hypothetical protein